MSNSNGSLTSEAGPFTVPFGNANAKELECTGGKGANLARLVDAALPVPEGFCVTTAAYRTLIDTPDIRSAIESLDALDPNDTDEIAEATAEIRLKIQQRTFPENVRRAVLEALGGLDADAYAVRSSSTAEDLPSTSFAGQHESYLGVHGPDAVLERVRDCMASLFTDRSVSYRLQNDVSHDDVAMAVVVQTMVDPDVAGVLFTADPVSGNRHVASVDANYGLGDTVVAGEVSPDNARVNQRTGEVLEYDIGEKGHALRLEVEGRRHRKGGHADGKSGLAGAFGQRASRTRRARQSGRGTPRCAAGYRVGTPRRRIRAPSVPANHVAVPTAVSHSGRLPASRLLQHRAPAGDG